MDKKYNVLFDGRGLYEQEIIDTAKFVIEYIIH